MIRSLLLMSALISPSICAALPLTPPGPAPTSLAEFVALPRPEPTHELRYGDAPPQVVDIFLPEGVGPFPVAILIHGGCWRDLPGAGREQLRQIGAELAGDGIAAWSIGYRRADEPGGGYPGTFRDVADAMGLLRTEAPRLRLDVARSVLFGHSAGGHLALWAAADGQLPATQRLSGPAPLIPAAVISLAGIGDLRSFAPFVPTICGPGVIESLAAGDIGDGGILARISPAEMPAPDIPVVMVSGLLDRLVPPYVADDYARAVQKNSGASVLLADIPGAGHFDLVRTGTPAWSIVRTLIADALQRGQGAAVHPSSPSQ